jgi:hypothetical protein
LSGGKETVFKTVFFLECPGMSQPLDSATPGRPPKVPFFWRERYVFVFLGENNCACGHYLILPLGTNLYFGAAEYPKGKIGKIYTFLTCGQ